MAAEEQMLIDYGLSVSLDNILESSNSMLPQERCPHGSIGEVTSQLSLNNTQVERKKNPAGASNKTSRKSSSQLTRTVKTTNLTDDGFGWRKYGQKNIHNNPHPRSYYRCTHTEEKCEAKKWVQKESDNPPIYNTTYLGNHTCQNPLKVPQIFLPYTFFEESFDPQYYSSMSNPTLLCFDSLNSNHTYSSHITTNDQYITGQMGFAPLSSSPQAADPIVFSDEPTITNNCINMAEGIQRQLSDEIETYENGIGMMTAANSEYSSYFPPMESPSCSFRSYNFDMMMMDEFIVDLDSVMNYME